MEDNYILFKDITDYVMFDVETTGISCGNFLIQLSALRIRNGQITGAFDEYVNPNTHIPSKITKMTGISDETVKDADNAENVIQRFFEFCGEDILIGHNVKSYDIPLTELKTYSFKNGVIDTRYAAEGCGIKPSNNEACAKLYNVDYSKAHNALEDCKITFAWFSRLLESYPDKEAKITYYLRCEDKCLELPTEVSFAIAENRRLKQQLYSTKLKRLINKTIGFFDAHGYERKYLEYVCNCDDSISVWLKEPVTNTRSLLCKIIANADGDCYNVTVNGNIIESKADIDFCPMQKRMSKAGKITQEIQISFDEPHKIRILSKILYICINNYCPSERFGCCDLYVKCSDAKQCIREDKIYSNACWYKQNLMKGLIFYGKNKNAGE